MIIVKISSGLGNQLFQYAFAKALSLNRSMEVKIDASNFDYWPKNITPRKFSLSNFNISLDLADKKDFREIGVPYPGNHSIGENIYRLIFKLKESLRKNKKIIIDHRLNFNPEMLSVPDNTYILGGWTNYNYFQNIKDDLYKELTLKKDFGPKAQKLHNQIESSESVSVHIRRSDYLKYSRKFVILDEKYYQEAVNNIKDRISNPIFYIFSDDIEYVQNNYSEIFGQSAIYLSGQGIEDEEELMLMSKCKHNIIANSTFSWWAAWLNQNSSKIIVAPHKYRTDNKEMEDFLPSDWISI